MRPLAKMTAAALLGLSVAAMGASAASAAVACNGAGECWHVRRSYNYRPDFGVTVHPDNWRWGRHEHYRWREHEGRGYWRNGVWLNF